MNPAATEPVIFETADQFGAVVAREMIAAVASGDLTSVDMIFYAVQSRILSAENEIALNGSTHAAIAEWETRTVSAFCRQVKHFQLCMTIWPHPERWRIH